MKRLIILLMVLSSCVDSKPAPKELVGKWECYSKELNDGTTKTSDLFIGEKFEYSCDGLILELKYDLTGYESIGGMKFNYEMNDSILTLGTKNYIIEKLTTTELIIRDYPSEGINILNFRDKFRRIE